MAQGRLEGLGLLGRRALARRLDRAGALQAEQRGVVVGRDHEVDPGQAATTSASPRSASSAAAARARPPRASDGRRPGPERGEQPGPGVVRGAAADAHDDLVGTLSTAASSSCPTPQVLAAGVALVGAEQVQPARLRRLDVGRAPAVALDHEHRGGHLATERVADRRRDRRAAEGPGEHVEEAWTAVGQGQQLDLVVRRAVRPALGHRGGRLDGAERGAEGVRGDEDVHAARLSVPDDPERPVSRSSLACGEQGHRGGHDDDERCGGGRVRGAA